MRRRLLYKVSGIFVVGAGLLRHAICEINHKYQSFSSDVAGRANDDTQRSMSLRRGQVVMVTGGSGFLGQHIIKLLQERAPYVKEIRVFDKTPFTKRLDYLEKKPLMSIIGDLRDVQQVTTALEGVDAVIHTAGMVSFGTFPDFEGMEQVNVKGTQNIISACLKQNVQRLVYTSTIDVVIGYKDIIDGDERLPIPGRFLFPGYPETKARAEEKVLQANGIPLGQGERSELKTLALRPNVMYGELDPYFITNGLKAAKKNNGVLQRVGDGSALFQQAYVGNMAWGHLVALMELELNPPVGGHAYFITDDTPKMNSFTFMDHFLKERGFSLSKNTIPYCVVYAMLKPAEVVVNLLRPLLKIELPTQLCSVKYLNMNIYFSRKKAEEMLNYSPIYSYEESVNMSKAFYNNLLLEENDNRGNSEKN